MIDCIKIRHQLHARPELSNQESWTATFVVEQLKKIGVSKIHTGFGYTIRTFRSDVLAQYKQKITDKIKILCTSTKLDYDISWFEAFSANNNHSEATKNIELAELSTTVLNLYKETNPWTLVKILVCLQRLIKAHCLRIGSGVDCPALHTTDYDFPDELIEIGSSVFYQLSLPFIRF